MKSKTRRKNSVLIVAGIAIAAAMIGSVALFTLQQQPTSQGDNKPMVMHIHPSIVVADSSGKSVPLPTNIGINPSLWKDHSLDQYGMQGMSPLHTHDSSGTVHVESNAERGFTLGEFLGVWGGIDQGKITKVTSDGIEVEDYASHVFKDGERITIETAV